MFKRAERKQVKLKLAITGPSGSGKTYSALKIAQGLGGKIALVDTENSSASLYSDSKGMPEFDTCDVSPPYTVERYREAIQGAIKAGYETLVIDSLSHVWAGEGGLLDEKEALDARGGRQNSYTNWASITKKHEQFKSEILNSDINIIGTMRSKQEYAQIEENGKKKIQKLGMAPVQRDGIEYEFTIVFDMAMNHTAEVSKDRTGLFDGKIFKPTEETGKEIKQWTDSGLTQRRDKQPDGHQQIGVLSDDSGLPKTGGHPPQGNGEENSEHPKVKAIKLFLGANPEVKRESIIEELRARNKKPQELSDTDLASVFEFVRKR